jgi:hypothetical protein
MSLMDMSLMDMSLMDMSLMDMSLMDSTSEIESGVPAWVQSRLCGVGR